MPYFVQLSEANTTINLAEITMVEWEGVPEELEGTSFTTTVSLVSGGGIYITRKDAAVLWKALQHYNARYTQAVVALPQLVSTLAALLIPLSEKDGQDGVGDAVTTANPAINQSPANGVPVGKVTNRERARAVSNSTN